MLQEAALTLERAITVAKRAETAVKNLKEMKAPQLESDSNASYAGVKVKSEPVHKLKATKKPPVKDDTVTCHRYGHPGHLATTCRFKDQVCHRCKKRGHLARVCRSQPKVASPNFQGVPFRKRPPQSVRQVGEESDEDSEVDSIQHLHTVEVEPG